jgi:predicted SAM-dependent methyltransferase
MVSCFCNNKIIKSFNPFNKKNNRSCPSCESLERHRFVHFLLNKSNINFEKTLHIAPEKQLNKLFRSISKQYICGDINPKRYRIPNVIQLDVTNIPFKNEFELVFASHILEHIIEDRKAIKEIYNALVFNGRFITLIPQKLTLKTTYEDNSIVTEKDRITHFGQKDHVRWYGLDFSQRLKDAGFYIKLYYVEGVEQYINDMIHDEKIQLATKEDLEHFGFYENDIIYECIKKPIT